MKFGQLIEYNNRNIFVEKSWRNWGGETSSRPLCFLYMVKASGQQLSFKILIALNLTYNKNKLHKTLDYGSRDMLNFDF